MNPSLFSCHNHCKIKFGSEYLTAFRFENRILFHQAQNDTNTRLPCGVTPTAIGHFHSTIHNYVVLQRNDDSTTKRIISLPRLPQMHPLIRGNQSWEDPRLFFDQTTQRLFLTGTVLTLSHVRIALAEIDPVSLVFKKGFVLGTNDELKEDAPNSQKNWCLFNDRSGGTFILTHALPWTIFRINLDTGVMSDRVQSMDSYSFFASEIEADLHVRCSSGMVRWSPGSLLTVLHVRDYDREGRAARYRSLFVEFEDHLPFRLLRKSKVIQFMESDHRVEFVAGLCEKDNNTLYISIGLDDMKSATIEYLKHRVF
ncbi:MAG: hypothetical protein EOP45_11085 [Sphingobacteriaceae bacterium]|nr:MAG: hypothetical protein EOP45_11085 [Sphingobacteriaceae bacterium]